MAHSPAPDQGKDITRDALYRRITLRLIPFIFICYLFNYLDRVNVGFAKLQMLDALKFSETVYGLGAGIFFIGYVLCGLPSNLALNRFGPRRWIAVMMIAWGTLSTCLLFVTTPTEFYALRLLTGAAEAGFFPGVVLYLSRWFPADRRGRIMALFMSAIPVSGLLGGPFSGWILEHFAAGQHGLAGWQWMFLIQGVPTVVLGILAVLLLSDGYQKATWLSPAERQLIESDLKADAAGKPSTQGDGVLAVLTNPLIWTFGFVYFCIQSGVYAINFWLPSIIKNLGFDNPLLIGWLSAIPYLLAGVFMIIVGRSADLRNERRWHLVVPMLMGALGLLIAVNFAGNPTIAILDRHHGRAHRPADVLADADRPAQCQRGGGGPCDHQLGGPDGWLPEPLPGRFHQGPDRLHRRCAVLPGRVDRVRQPRGPACDPGRRAEGCPRRLTQFGGAWPPPIVGLLHPLPGEGVK